MKFVLEIELGNDAMRTKEHVRTALREVAWKLKAGAELDEGGIRDINGNTVGGWRLEVDA